MTSRKIEGNAEQKRAAAREAHAHGKEPSEVGATTGASKQRKKAPSNATHQEKLDLIHEGKLGGRKATKDEEPSPRSRDTDPHRNPRKWE